MRQELEKLPGPRVSSELIDFIEYLLVVDHTRRPTVLEAYNTHTCNLLGKRKSRRRLYLSAIKWTTLAIRLRYTYFIVPALEVSE